MINIIALSINAHIRAQRLVVVLFVRLFVSLLILFVCFLVSLLFC